MKIGANHLVPAALASPVGGRGVGAKKAKIGSIMSGQDLVTIENYEISTESIVIFIIEHGVWGPVIL